MPKHPTKHPKCQLCPSHVNPLKKKHGGLCPICFSWLKVCRLAEKSPFHKKKMENMERYRTLAENQLPLFEDDNSHRKAI